MLQLVRGRPTYPDGMSTLLDAILLVWRPLAGDHVGGDVWGGRAGGHKRDHRLSSPPFLPLPLSLLITLDRFAKKYCRTAGFRPPRVEENLRINKLKRAKSL